MAKDKLNPKTAPFFVCFRSNVPNSPMVKEGDFFRQQVKEAKERGETFGTGWEPVDATSIGDARRKCAAEHGVTLSFIYNGEE